MILQSPESPMPEPYKTYVQQRSDSIKEVLEVVVGETDVQLCPRAITEEERVFARGQSIVYGAVVCRPEIGFKSDLYIAEKNSEQRQGIVARNLAQAVGYAASEFIRGNRVRIKDPKESDCQGQLTISSVDELEEYFAEAKPDLAVGTVLMPHLVEITDEISVGYIDLGKHGEYKYLGRECKTRHEGQTVYGGTSIGLVADSNSHKLSSVASSLEIPEEMADIGKYALLDFKYCIATEVGRVSIDVVRGYTDNGTLLTEAIDITPRVGGVTPAEVLAIQALDNYGGDICYATSRLLYNPSKAPKTGKNFINTDSLVINGIVDNMENVS